MVDEKIIIFQISRSKLQMETKCILYNSFKENIEDCYFLLKQLNLLKNDNDIHNEISKIIKNKCSMVSINDDEYPILLKQINTAPLILTLKGDKKIMKKSSITLVGTRDIEKNDNLIINKIVEITNNSGFLIISGLAKGSDCIAHMKSLKYGTIAVMPCGLNYCYPKENNFLMEKIIDLNGAVISDFIFTEQPKKYNFLQRNRIIAGICHSTIIARARDIKSGTISTANYSLKYGKSVYTYNFSDNSDGNKYLLKNKLAKEIKNFDELQYNLLIDKVKNEELLDIIKQKNIAKNTSTKQLFKEKIPENIISKEIDLILRKTNCKFISERQFEKILTLCCNELKIDKQDIIKQMLIKLYFQKK